MFTTQNEKKKNTDIRIRTSTQEKEEITRAAEKNDTTVSDFLRMVIREELKKDKYK